MRSPIIAQVPFLMLIALLVPALAVAGNEPDWGPYNALLRERVAQGEKHGVSLTVVDYAGLGHAPRMAQALKVIARFPRDRLNGRDERLAFYINAYNLLALHLVAEHWPVDSIKDIGGLFHSVWGQEAGIVAGRALSLDDIENDILRPMGDPRIHFAIVCASVSCPDLRMEAYRADRLQVQLNDQVRTFLANTGKGMHRAGNTLTLSPIFDWFAKDFDTSGGVVGFIRRYRHDVPAGVHVRYFDYDWSVNAGPR